MKFPNIFLALPKDQPKDVGKTQKKKTKKYKNTHCYRRRQLRKDTYSHTPGRI